MELPPFVFAVDCPSGVDFDTGEVAAETIRADSTITMAAVKNGLLKLPAFEMIGDLQVVDIGLPNDLESFNQIEAQVADHKLVSTFLPERKLDSHKGTYGTAVIKTRSTSYMGAGLFIGMVGHGI